MLISSRGLVVLMESQGFLMFGTCRGRQGLVSSKKFLVLFSGSFGTGGRPLVWEDSASALLDFKRVLSLLESGRVGLGKGGCAEGAGSEKVSNGC